MAVVHGLLWLVDVPVGIKTKRSMWARNARVPTIAAAAVQAYLQRDLANFDFLKEVPRAELLTDAHRRGHRFATDPWHNQLVCFNIAAVMPNFLFFKEMGGGKSSVIANQIRFRKRLGQLQQALIMVPELIHCYSWEEQLKTHAPDLQYRLLDGNAADRKKQLERGADVFVGNFGAMQSLMTQQFYVKRKNKDADGNEVEDIKHLITPESAGEFAARFNFLCLDELHRVTNPKSLFFDCFRWLSAAAAFRYVLDGTPWDGFDPTPLFHYFKLIDGGATFGTLGMFQKVFFTPKQDYFAGIKWTFNKQMHGELSRMLKNRSIYYEMKEMRDMPAKVPIRLPIKMTGEGRDYYRRIEAKAKEARGDYRSMESEYIRMRQCASGYLSLKADDESRIQIQFNQNPKLDGLHQFLLSRPNEKMLIFHEYNNSGALIEKMLTQARIGYAALNGRTKDVRGEYSRFLNEPLKKCRIFVLNNKLGAEAINPQYVARRGIFFESPDNPKQRAQAEARLWRPGQAWNVFLHDLLVEGTIEEKIFRNNIEGIDTAKAILSGRMTLEIEE